QPLVENAILHGIAKSAVPGCVTVTSRPANGGIELCIRDTGNGKHGGTTIAEGRGLGITRQRLAANYPRGAGLSVQSLDEGGFEARLIVPSTAGVEGEDGGAS
ncbi:MAG TPA: signlal transduction histidine kinase, LytS, partial [Thermoanaerobaculia bacterium]|nr:signlal transduction histidine kinase, LytS [Thermoanaerobaculia bacterium]